MAQTKQTKKFEKRHLKDTLERRKGLKKVKQRQQVKAKKKSRRAEENGRPSESDTTPNGGQNASTKKSSRDTFNEMSVDDFFQGGFDIPAMPKRKSSKRKRDETGKEDEESSQGSFEEEPVPQGSESGSEDDEENEDLKQQLDALAQNDPEFHKYLQEDEPELLDAEFAGLSHEEEDDGAPKRKKAKRDAPEVSDDEEDEVLDGGKNELDKATIEKWRAALTTQHSLRAAREVVLAFRSAAHVSDEQEEQEFKYSISDPDVYHELLTLALKQIPEVFQHHLPVQEGKNGKAHVETGSKKFKTLTPLLRSQISSIVHLLDHLTDAPTLRLTLSSTLPLLPYLLSFKKLVRTLLKPITAIWSTPSSPETVRIAAFLILRRLTIISDAGIRENVLKSAYQGLVKGSRNTTTHNLAGINLMKNSASELWGLVDGSVAYTTAFTFIRQLAIHLRGSIQNNQNEGYKNVYNWQYVHSLDFWSRVLSAHCPATEEKGKEAGMRPLVYPLVQATLGALRLIPTATYFPLRFQLVRSLLRLSRTTGTYIPLAAPLYEVLASAEMRKAPKPSTLKPMDFGTSIRAPKGYLRTRVYQDGVGEQVQELLAEFLVLWCKNIAFPELSLAVTVMLKRWLKDVNNRTPNKGNRNQKVNGMISLLVQKIEANARFIEERRAKVEFAPDNRKQVDAFLEDLAWEKTPLGAFVVGMRKQREQRERIAAQGRKEDERRGRVDGKKGGREMREESESEESDDGDDVDMEDEDGVEIGAEEESD